MGVTMSSASDQSSFLYAGNAQFLADLYARYERDPSSVDDGWARFFDQFGDPGEVAEGDAKGPSWGLKNGEILGDLVPGADGWAEALLALAPSAEPIKPAGGKPQAAPAPQAAPSAKDARAAAIDSIRALMLIRAYRVRGHLEASLDPLGLEKRGTHPELDPMSYGFTEADWDKPIFINFYLGLETASLRTIVERLRAIYCGCVGVEYQHIQDPDQKRWLQERIENDELNYTQFTDRGKHAIYERLVAAESFEKFLNLKYTGTKRFGLDGAEAMVPALEQIMKRGGQMGLKEIVLGMAHRGRLNVLANVMGKPFQAIFSEFQGQSSNPDEVQGSGDVKYHLGTSSDRDFDGSVIHLSLTPIPSHLVAVNPVGLG